VQRYAAVIALSLLVGAAPLRAATAERSEELSWDVERGLAVAVDTHNGDIKLRRSRDAKLHVRALKSGTGSEEEQVLDALDRVRIQATKSEGRLKVTAQIPSDIKGGGLLSTIFGKDVSVTVHYDLAVPAGVSVDAETVNGEIDALGLQGDLELNSVNGSIVVASHEGDLDAETVNGALSFEAAGAVTKGSVQMSTVNGAVDVTLRDGSRAELTADSLNGSIRTDFDLSVRKRLVGSEADGAIGEGGGATIALESINGPIRINRQGGRPARAAASGREEPADRGEAEARDEAAAPEEDLDGRDID